MKIKVKSYRVPERKKVDLKKRPHLVKPIYSSKEHYEEILSEHISEMRALQNLLYASNRHSLLIILQGMDSAGKDGIINHVMSGVNPQGCQVFSFKHPSPVELEHDFLWRTTRDLPERGKIGIFNRSYYEEVLITRVHPEILKGEGPVSCDLKKKDKDGIWEERYRSISSLERHLHVNGTKIIKLFLHLSYEEQARRFLDRIDDPKKNWKLSADDMKERSYWKDYMKAYEACLSATSTTWSPWYVIPADDKLNARLITSQIILDVLHDFRMSYPKVDANRLKELKSIRKQLKKNL